MNDARLPNILFFFPDQLRADWLGCANQVPVRTPRIDALAARGVRFDRAYCTSPLCAPSRASLAAGMRPHRIGVHTDQEDFPLDCPTVYRILRDAGYRVGAVGKTDLHKPTHWNGPDGWTARMGRLGFTETVDSAGKWDAVDHCRPGPHDPYTTWLASRGLLETHCEDYRQRRQAGPRGCWASPLAREDHPDEFVGRAGLRLLEQFPREAPWFLQVNFPSPHDPLDPPTELLSRWQDADLPLPIDPVPGLTGAEHLAARRSYAALIEGVDEWCGRMIDLVAARGELDQTLIVLASDHGDMLGDHGRWGHSWFYEPAVAIPLIVAGPGVGEQVSSALVELPDLAATFLDFAGLPLPPRWEARSLSGLLRGETRDHREVIVSVLPGHRCVLDERFKLIIRDGQIPALFDRENDPAELHNATGNHPEMLTLLAERLGEEIGASAG